LSETEIQHACCHREGAPRAVKILTALILCKKVTRRLSAAAGARTRAPSTPLTARSPAPGPGAAPAQPQPWAAGGWAAVCPHWGARPDPDELQAPWFRFPTLAASPQQLAAAHPAALRPPDTREAACGMGNAVRPRCHRVARSAPRSVGLFCPVSGRHGCWSL